MAILNTFYNREEKSLRRVAMVAKFFDDNKPKCHLKFSPNHEFVDQMNSVQSSWKAGVYEEYNGMTVEQLMRRAGGPKMFDFPKTRFVLLQY